MDSLEVRRFVIGTLIILVILIFIGRLFFIQVMDSSYKFSAENNSQRYVTQYPARGLIYDRSGKLLVYNEAAYDLMVNPMQLKAFDSATLCEMIDISKETLRTNLQHAKNYSRYKPSVILKQLSSKTYAVLQEQLYKYPGFFVQPRTLRKYADSSAAHVLGYVGEVDNNIIKKEPYYQMGDYIGISGIEKSYEKVLRGKKGVNIYLVDVHNRIKGSYDNGKYDTAAVFGSNLVSSLDIGLQEYGEELMQNKMGSIVAIDPESGEILSLVSSPSYDPSLLIGRVRTNNYRKLLLDTLKPLFNRAVMAKYPPGSTFKVINALIGLQEGVINNNTEFSCHYGYTAGGIHVGCHGHKSPLNLPESIQISCNAYYCNVFRRIIDNPVYNSTEEAYDVWRNYVTSFGFGQKLNTDLVNELDGFVPKPDYYNRYYGENGWKSLTIISLAIGQGELGITPIQMANMAATVANRGYYYIPHVVHSVQGENTIDDRFTKKHYTKIDSANFEKVIEGMYRVVNGGEGSTARIAAIDSIAVCGKTGTAQNPHGKDHSIFIAFAPRDNPKIAISVFVENAGFGSTWAAPIASLMIEKYLKGHISRRRKWLEQRVLNGDLIHNHDEKN